MSPWLRRLGTAMAVAGSLVFIGYVVSTLDFERLREHLTPRAFGAMGVAILLYALLVPVTALAWKWLLAALSHRKRWAPLMAILATTQAGKYLPGNVGHHVGRVGLSLRLSIPLAVLLASMAYELCLVLLAILFTVAGAGAASGPGLQLLLQTADGRAGVVVALVIAAAGILAIPLLSRAVHWMTALVVRRRSESTVAPPMLPLRAMLAAIALYVICMLLVGGSLAVLSFGFFPEVPVDYAFLTAAFSLAWVVGFVTPGAPAGLGVREAVLLLLLGPALGTADASLLILALRVVTTLGDIMTFAVGGLMLTRLEERPDDR